MVTSRPEALPPLIRSALKVKISALRDKTRKPKKKTREKTRIIIKIAQSWGIIQDEETP
jgi:hypothetical protein